MPRYRVSGLPPQASKGLSAFFPYFTRLAGGGAQQYKDGLTGRPGAPGVMVGSQGQPAADRTALALKGTASTVDAPPFIFPSEYWARPQANYRPGLLVQMYDPTAPELTTMIPVPAVSGRQHRLRKSAALSGGIQSGGSSRRQVSAVARGLSVWKNRMTGNGQASG